MSPPFGSESYSVVYGLPCPNCRGKTDIVVDKRFSPYKIAYARCEEFDCSLSERQRKDLLKEAIKEIMKHG